MAKQLYGFLRASDRLVTTPSGLHYTEAHIGSGAEAAPGHLVTIQYTGWLNDGEVFGRMRDAGQAFTFCVGAGEVIRGWEDGVTGMRVGGQRRLFIPPHLGYGVRGVPGLIPPNAMLIVDVELLGML